MFIDQKKIKQENDPKNRNIIDKYYMMNTF